MPRGAATTTELRRLVREQRSALFLPLPGPYSDVGTSSAGDQLGTAVVTPRRFLSRLCMRAVSFFARIKSPLTTR